ncbi:hypothetical protein [Streptomyces sp. bgisy154]|uniref:hypothetical protein n=1 Tax=Streptomyces sp. bgisy154 TaxID=3413794 RepID=UPI003D75A91F
MSENRTEPVVLSEAQEEAAPDIPPQPVKKPVRWGRIATAAGAALVVGAVVAGVGYTVVTVRDADRDAGDPVWAFPEETAPTAVPPSPTGLAGVIVPYDTEWDRGPDLEDFGADAQLSGKRAAALRKQAFSDLPRTERKQLEKEIDKERVRGMAMRSYAGPYGSDGVTVSIVLTQMDNKSAVRDASSWQNDFLADLDAIRKGPEVEDHKNTKCFLPPKEDADEDEDDEEALDAMICSGYVGDVLVNLTASGESEALTDYVPRLLANQLDRIKAPGAAV